jgi:hypothetical protein
MASNVEERNWMLPYGVTLATISTIVIALRLYSRLPGKLGLDDIFIVLAWMLSTVSTALTIWSKDQTSTKVQTLTCFALSMHKLRSQQTCIRRASRLVERSI